MTRSSGRGSCAGVTVAIPVYNEEQILVANTRRLLAYLGSLGVPYEVIIGSNGSTDATMTLGEQLARDCPTVSFFHLPSRGVGLAFREFIGRAKFPTLISLDMDLSADIRFVEQALAFASNAEIVIGSKKLAEQRRPLIRKAGSDLFLWCARQLTGLSCDDYSIGAKAYRVDFLREFSACVGEGSSYVLDLCVVASQRGRDIQCIPVACEDRRASKFNLLHEACYKFRRLFAVWATTVRAAPIENAGGRNRIGTIAGSRFESESRPAGRPAANQSIG